MKRLTLTTLTFFSPLAAFAQWNQSTLTGASYHTGAIAIGFDPPSYPLHIMTGSNMDRSFGFTSADDLLSSRSSLFYTASGLGSGLFQNAGNLFIQPRTNAQRGIYFNTFDGTSTASRLAITWNGKVGIGTATPAFNLDLVNGLGPATLRIQGHELQSSWRARLLLDRMEDFRGAGVWIEASEGTENDWYAGVPYSGNGFTIGNHASQPEYKDNSLLFVKPNGQTGIGTTEPVGSFDVMSHLQSIPNSENVIVNILSRPSPGMADNLSQFSQEVGATGDVTNAVFRMGNMYTNGGTPDEVVLRTDGNSWIKGGNLGIGTSQPAAALHVSMSNPSLKVTATANNREIKLEPGNGAIESSNATLQLNRFSTRDVALAVGGGDVGIGTAAPDAKLTVKGTVHAEEVKVDLSVPGPDYVFEKDYPLASLDEVAKYIGQNKHLPDVPSAKEMEENGVDLGEMDMILLRKIEELTLYVIELKKENAALDLRISIIESKKQ